MSEPHQVEATTVGAEAPISRYRFYGVGEIDPWLLPRIKAVQANWTDDDRRQRGGWTPRSGKERMLLRLARRLVRLDELDG